MDTKWTPGPWIAEPCRKQQWAISAPNGDPTIGHSSWHGLAVYGCDDSPAEGRIVSYANARLIAAAPDLYEALNDILTADDKGDQWGAAALRARAALAKARGETA